MLFHVHCQSFFNLIILIYKKEKKKLLFCCELPLMCCSLWVCLVERILGVTEEGRGSEVFISLIEKKIGRKDRDMGRYFHPVPHILIHPKGGRNRRGKQSVSCSSCSYHLAIHDFQWSNPIGIFLTHNHRPALCFIIFIIIPFASYFCHCSSWFYQLLS